MGAIAAVIGIDLPSSVSHVERGLRAAPHRGGELNTVALGRAVLGVVNTTDLVDAWVATVGHFAVALVGSLDNQAELLSELRLPESVVSHGETPARTVAAAFGLWGDDTCSRMRGDYAAAVSDGQQLWVFRDHLGSSPLYYHVDADCAFAASEAKQVAAGVGISREPDLDAINRLFFSLESDDREPPCAIVGVARVPRSSVALLSPGATVSTRRYWDPSNLVGTSRFDEDETRERLLELLEQAVERTVTGNDVVSLSGGIDSPTVAAFAAPAHLRKGGEPLRALSAVYPHTRTVDESRFIEPVVDKLGLRWQTYVPKYRQLDNLEQWVDRFDGPIPNLGTSALSEHLDMARTLGVRTVLSGELAELLFDLRHHLEGHLVLQGHWFTAGTLLRAHRRKGASWRGLFRGLVADLVPSRAGVRYAHRFGRAGPSAPEWIDPDFISRSRHWEYLDVSPRRRWPDGQLRPALSPTSVSVELSSICAAHSGVHLRRPLVDLDLWEFFLSLPAHIKFADPVRKSVVREAMRGRVPDVVLDRKDKTAFGEDVLGRVDYRRLRRWILDTDFQLRGINYELVRQVLENEALEMKELTLFNHLASVHAFVGLWS